MKKRILSLILALVLVFGVALVPSVGTNAASKNTTLTLKNKSVAVTVKKAQRTAAAKDLNKFLGTTVKSGKSFVVVINGKKYKATNKKGTIYVAGNKLTDFVNSRGALTEKTSIQVKVNFKNVVRLMTLAKKSSFNYTVKVGKATIKNVKVTGKKMTFTGNGKKFTATIKSGKIVLTGNQSKTAFVKNLKKAGVVK